jgi:hypothetical protein
VVLVVGTGIVALGLVGVLWYELFPGPERPPQGRLRLTIEVLLPVIGAVALLAWLWA